MNKIYKVMYSKVKQCAVVVSEIAKSHGHNGESSSMRKHTALMAAVLIALGSFSFTTALMPMTAEAADKTKTDGSNFVGVERRDGLFDDSVYANYNGHGAHGDDSITVGLKASGGDGTITIGDRRAEQSLGSVYVGRGPGMPTGKVLPDKTDDGYWATSVGYQSDATGYGSIAIGSNATANNSYDKDSTGHGITLRTTSGDGKTVVLNGKPDIQRASVAIGYGANADNGNIAIGSYSDASTDLRTAKTAAYLTDTKAGSYVSVGKSDALRRISNVADGAAATDVATVGQLQALSKELGGYEAGFGIKIDPDSTDTTKNTISLKRNLGTNYGNEYKGKGNVTFEADGENALILGGGAINDSSYEADKDFTYGAHAKDSVLVGGMNNDIEKNSERALIVGGTNNKIFSTGEVQQTGTDAIIVGGSGNKAEGDSSILIGGNNNEATGLNATIIGGSNNKNDGWDASIWGGYDNQITGIAQASGIFGGFNNKVVNNGFTYILGGENNSADGGLAVIVGGGSNKSSGLGSSVFGGADNTATGESSSIIGGLYNAATNYGDVISGGFGNLTSGEYAYAAGGTQNYVTNTKASSFGGKYSSVNGAFSTGVAGGSTGQEAFFSLSAGYQSVVTDGGVEKTYLTGEDANKVLNDMYSGKKLSGYYISDPSVESGPENPGRLIHYDKFSTALGYQATADKAGTIAFGHDAGDESGYTYEWEQLPKDKDGYQTYANDGTTNDYTKPPKSVKKKAPYTSAYYNRLVKVADGIDDHDVVVMKQLKQYAEKDASNLGNNIKVYKTDANGNVQLDKDKKPIEDTDATTTAQNGSKDAWGKALGAGTFTTGTSDKATDASTSDQLVTGKTLYNYDKPTGTQNYVKDTNTTGQNLSALDAQVKANADALTKPNHNIKYYSVTAGPSLGYDQYTNENNDGTKGTASLAAGNVTHTDGAASTVVGSYSAVFGTGLQGAAALSYGTVNVNNNTDTTKKFSGVANSIVGQANMTTNSNAAIIYGAGNTVTNSYRDIDEKKAEAIFNSAGNAEQLQKALQDAVSTSGGQVMVMGGGNKVDSAYMTQVTGVGNTVKGNQVQNADGKWVTDESAASIKDYDEKKSSHYNYVDGFNNDVINGKHDYIIGANNTLTGDSYDDDSVKPIKKSNQSNIVIGDNHTLDRKKNTVIIGSSDTANTVTNGSDAVIIGHNANAASDNGADNAVAIGRSAKATGGNAVTIGVNTSAGENSITIGSESSAISGSNIAIGRYARVYGDNVTNAVALGENTKALVSDGVAIGSQSQATVKGNSVEGYDPATGNDSENTTATWKATKGAVSIGTADGKVTRQINGLAAGTKDTDAVNVAQLKKLGDNTVQYDLNTNKGKITLAGQNGTTITNVKSALDGAKDAEGKDATIATATGDALKNAANLGDLQKVYKEVNEKADKASASHTALTVEGGTSAGTKDEKTKEDVYAGKNILLHESTDENGKVTYDLKLAKDINIGTPGKDGEDGKIGIDGRDGHIGLNGSDGITVRGLDGENGAPGKDGVTITGPKGADGIDGKVGISGTDGKDAVSITGKDGVGHIGLTGPKGEDGQPGTSIDITVKNGYNVDGKDGKDGINGENGVDGTKLTRVVYEDANGKHQIATLEDGLKFKGDDGKEIAKKLNNTLDIIGGADSTKLTEKNIGVNKTDDGKLKIQLAQELNGITSIGNQKTEDGKTTGGKITFGTDSSVNVNGGKITNVGNGVEKDSTGKYTVTEQNKTNGANIGDVQNIVNDAKKELTDSTNSSLNGKANVDASNLSDANVTAWQKKLGNGSVADGNSGLVNGGTLYSEVRPADGNYVKSSQTTGANLKALDDKIGTLDNNGNYIQKDATISQNLKTLDTQVKNNTDAISNINTNIGKLSDSVVKYDGTDKKTVTLAGEGGTTITNVKDGALNKDSTDAVNGKQLWQEQQDRKDMKNLSDTGKIVIRELAKGSVKVIDGTNTKVSTGTDGDATTYAVNVEGNGTVESGNKGLISGGTAYTELRPADGSYVKQNSTTAANLTALDNGLKTTSDLIHTAGDTIQIGENSTATKIDVSGKDANGKTTGRVITGVISDAGDPNSAANVGYVNGVTAANTQQIYRDMNNAYGRLNNNINKAAAGSNALAALHPLDYDPDDKADFAVGYGHYRNANAAAVGAFYHPNENTMVNVGVSLGNGDPGFNAGVSFKIGSGSAGHQAMSKTEMAKVINSQSKEIDALKKDNADKDKRIDALEQKMAEILAKLDKNGK